ncbi:MAG: efflux RND transporter periplasmic adaptor subunit [Xanthobacteraceae bacterium]
MSARIRAVRVARRQAPAVVVALALGLVLPELLPAAPAMREAGHTPGRVVTVAQTRNVCFSDTLQVTGVLVPRNEVLVRPDREGLQISQVQVEPGDTVVAGQVLARLALPDGQGARQATGPATGPGIPVRAPVAGVVVASTAVVGAMASGRGQPLFRIAAQGEMELLAETPVATLASLAPNQAAAVEIVGIGSLPGRVRLISGTINQATQLGQVRVFIGSDAQLRAGAFGRARIDLAQRCGTAVPLSAVLYGSGGPVVQVVRDGRIESQRVKVGLISSGLAEIRDGLSEGDMVVARAGAFLREGDRVRPVVAGEPVDQPK